MKKRSWIAVLVLIILAGFVWMGLRSKTVEQSIILPYGHTRVMEQLSDPRQLAHWYQPFAGNTAAQVNGGQLVLGEDKIALTTSSALAVALQASKGSKYKMVYFKALPDTLQRNQTEVTLVYKTTLFGQWFGGGLEAAARKSLAGLKAWMEDTKAFYGYTIEQVNVADTTFLFATRAIATANLKQGSEALFAELIAHAQQQQLNYSGTRIFNIRKLSATETELYASIGINRRIISKPGDAYQFKAMPGGKNLLVAHYRGPFKDVQQAYEALDSYRRDRGLLSMAMPFCKIMQEGTGFTGDEVVTLDVTLPVY